MKSKIVLFFTILFFVMNLLAQTPNDKSFLLSDEEQLKKEIEEMVKLKDDASLFEESHANSIKEEIEKKLEQFSNVPSIQLCKILYDREKYQEAIKQSEKVIKSYINNDIRKYLKVYAIKGLAEERLEQYDHAIEDFTKYIQYSTDSSYLANRGECYIQKGNYTKGKQDISLVLNKSKREYNTFVLDKDGDGYPDDDGSYDYLEYILKPNIKHFSNRLKIIEIIEDKDIITSKYLFSKLDSVFDLDVWIMIEFSNSNKVSKSEEMIEILFELCKKFPKDTKLQNLLSLKYGSLAWFQIFEKQFIEAEKSARLGLQADAKETWINANLALALLYQGKWKEAKVIYSKMKDMPYEEGTFKETFLRDLDDLESKGITHSNVAKARLFLTSEVDNEWRKEYKSIGNFSEGLACVSKDIEFIDQLKGYKGVVTKFGYVDEEGNEVTPIQYDIVSTFSLGFGIVKRGYYYGCINNIGTEIIPIRYDEIVRCKENKPMNLFRIKDNNLYGYIDSVGREVVIPKYDKVSIIFQEGLAVVVKGNKYGFIDKNGREIITPIFQLGEGVFQPKIKNIDEHNFNGYVFYEGVAKICQIKNRNHEKYGYIDKTGRVIIEPKYNYANAFSDGLALVNYNYFIDKRGIKIFSVKKYGGCASFKEGRARVTSRAKKNSKNGFIDLSGNLVVPLKYEKALSYSDGLAAVKLDGKWGFIDINGAQVIQPLYNSCGSFIKGLDLCKVEQYKKYGYINKKGDIVIPIEYDEIGLFSEYHTIVSAKKYGKTIDINIKGECVKNCQ